MDFEVLLHKIYKVCSKTNAFYFMMLAHDTTVMVVWQ